MKGVNEIILPIQKKKMFVILKCERQYFITALKYMHID